MKPGWPRSRATSIRSRPGSSTASSSAPCKGSRNTTLAEEWTEAMERWSHGERHRQPPRALPRPSRRDPQAPRIMRRGGEGSPRRVRRAASLPAPRARMAADRARAHPPAQGRPRGRRGGLSRRARSGWDPQPGLALVHLARGDVGRPRRRSGTRSSIRSRVPSKELPPNTELQRAPLLEAQVEIEIAAGDIARARRRPKSFADGGDVREQGAGRQRNARSRPGAARRWRPSRRGTVLRKPRGSGTRSARRTRRRWRAAAWPMRCAQPATNSAPLGARSGARDPGPAWSRADAEAR